MSAIENLMKRAKERQNPYGLVSTDTKEIHKVLAEAWEEGKEATARALLPNAEPLTNPYRTDEGGAS